MNMHSSPALPIFSQRLSGNLTEREILQETMGAGFSIQEIITNPHINPTPVEMKSTQDQYLLNLESLLIIESEKGPSIEMVNGELTYIPKGIKYWLHSGENEITRTLLISNHSTDKPPFILNPIKLVPERSKDQSICNMTDIQIGIFSDTGIPVVGDVLRTSETRNAIHVLKGTLVVNPGHDEYVIRGGQTILSSNSSSKLPVYGLNYAVGTRILVVRK